MKKIIVFNVGSATLKYKLFEFDDTSITELKDGSVENIGTTTGPKNHKLALSLLFRGFGVSLPSLAKIDGLVAIGHRAVYGGDEYDGLTKIDQIIINHLKKYNPIAPLHNPPIIEVMEDILSHTGREGHREIPNYALFDSSFYSNLPDKAKIYPLPYSFYKDYNIKRFGFHGIAHKNITHEILKNNSEVKKIISVHLGSGSSITATLDGSPIDTSMGFTPREGLVMCTRSGDIDPGILIYLLQKKIVKNVDELDYVLNHNSGLMGISEISSDMRDLLYIAGYPVEDKNYKPHSSLQNMPEIYKDKAKLAIDIYCYRAQKYIASYLGILNGCDVLVFTGAVGNESSFIRNKICSGLSSILKDTRIEFSPTKEELEIAKEIIKQLAKEE